MTKMDDCCFVRRATTTDAALRITRPHPRDSINGRPLQPPVSVAQPRSHGRRAHHKSINPARKHRGLTSVGSRGVRAYGCCNADTPAMSILESASVLHNPPQQNGSAHSGARGKKAMTAESEASRRRKPVASEGSVLSPLSPLIRLVRDPASALAGVIEGLRDQAGAEERAEKLRVEVKKRILYAKLKNV